MLTAIGRTLGVLLCIALPMYVMWVQIRKSPLEKNEPDFVIASSPEPDEYESEEFVVLAVFDTIVTADLCRIKLESEGIECLVLDRPVMGRPGRPSVAVKACNWHRAAELLEEVK